MERTGWRRTSVGSFQHPETLTTKRKELLHGTCHWTGRYRPFFIDQTDTPRRHLGGTISPVDGFVKALYVPSRRRLAQVVA